MSAEQLISNYIGSDHSSDRSGKIQHPAKALLFFPQFPVPHPQLPEAHRNLRLSAPKILHNSASRPYRRRLRSPPNARHFHSDPRPLPGNCPDALPHNQGSGIRSPIPVLSQSPHTVRHPAHPAPYSKARWQIPYPFRVPCAMPPAHH